MGSGWVQRRSVRTRSRRSGTGLSAVWVRWLGRIRMVPVSKMLTVMVIRRCVAMCFRG